MLRDYRTSDSQNYGQDHQDEPILTEFEKDLAEANRQATREAQQGHEHESRQVMDHLSMKYSEVLDYISSGERQQLARDFLYEARAKDLSREKIYLEAHSDPVKQLAYREGIIQDQKFLERNFRDHPEFMARMQNLSEQQACRSQYVEDRIEEARDRVCELLPEREEKSIQTNLSQYRALKESNPSKAAEIFDRLKPRENELDTSQER